MVLTDFISNEWILKILLIIGLVIIGILSGKIVNFLIKKSSEHFELKRKINESSIKIFSLVIIWAIYLSFVIGVISVLGIPVVTEIMIRILIIIPAFIGALVLLSVGFALAVYLRNIIEESEVTGWRIFANLIFYFIIYIVLMYSLRIALTSFNEFLRNIILSIFTAILLVSVAYFIVKKELKEHKTTSS